MDSYGNCIDRNKQNILLKKELDNFEPPKKVRDKDMKTVGIGKFTADLTPGEYEMFRTVKSRDYGLNAYALLKVFFILNNAVDTTDSLFSEFVDDKTDNPADAFRHAYWSALITQEFGEDFAIEFTTAHETRPDAGKEAAFMDLHNNQIGVNIALANPNATNGELQTAVLESLYSGQLYVWNTKNIYYSDQCPQCWWMPK